MSQIVKGPEAFRTISEAATELGVPQHVLRFWETKFSFIRPMKRAGGRRFYRRQDIDVLRGVRTLLHDNGYTIKACNGCIRSTAFAIWWKPPTRRRSTSPGQTPRSRWRRIVAPSSAPTPAFA